MSKFSGFIAVVILCVLPLTVPGNGTTAVKSAALGDPLPDLTPEQQVLFADGQVEFSTAETEDEGLGPLFNAASCGECHAHPAAGGASPELIISRELRFGTLSPVGAFDTLDNRGGPLRQQFLIHKGTKYTGEIITYPSPRDYFPFLFPGLPQAIPSRYNANLALSLRITTPLFGAGLMEAIPDAQIYSYADPYDEDGDGISGRPNLAYNPESGQVEIGRFGWKAQVPTLHLFAGDAYRNEMGITNPTFPQENGPLPGWCKTKNGLDDDGSSVQAFTNYMRFLAPAPRLPGTEQTARGEFIFADIGCASCHVPMLTTGDNEVAALHQKPVPLYSDILLHDMGNTLADGTPQALATGREWRTAPLWGLSSRRFFLHDGRALNVGTAILAHGGEAEPARNRYLGLNGEDRAALLAFLGTL